MKRMHMELTGFDELIAEFELMGNKAKKVETEALKEAGEVIAKYQSEEVNRSTKDQPHTQDNIQIGRARETDEGLQITVKPNSEVSWRAKFLEWGTSKMPPNPFIERSGQRGEAEAYRVMLKKLGEVIK
ncbi:hypothetical protein ACA30_05860 [Virgibacillus soli]|nr:hypothetical protein ACA30_05860 [Virgibacillus soli]